jgi:uncharacterized membrane protein
MDFPHLHLMLNHFPIIGTMVGTGLYLISLLVKIDDVRRSSLIVLVAMALLAVPVFMTGVGAQEKMVADPSISNTLIQRHEGAAELSIWFMEITGALAVIALWQSARTANPARWNTFAVLVFSLVTVSLMARTGNTGGEIRHSEVRSTTQEGTATGARFAEATLAYLEPSPARFTRLMIINKWWWALMMDVHFIGLVLLIGTIGMLNLRVLGFAKQVPIGALSKLVPWGIAGFGINVVTGLLAFIGMPTFYTHDIAFVLKIVAILLAATAMALFYLTHAFHDCEVLEPGKDAPLRAKIIAGTSLVLWFAVIVLGRYIQPLQDTIAR